ncbi:hypothetical protein GCM10028807_17450 [Spirosoma daeguense]
MTTRKSSLTSQFKAEAEKIAGKMREAMGLPKHSPLCAFKLAEHLGIKVQSIYDCGFKNCGERYSDWSAMLIYTKAGKPLIIHNKTHSLPRQQSDIMHEISHDYYGHPLSENSLGLLVPTVMLTVNPQHEEEASYLGATLQLPQKALSWAILQEKMPLQTIAKKFVASTQMVQYRVNIMGLSKELKRLTE